MRAQRRLQTRRVLLAGGAAGVGASLLSTSGAGAQTPPLPLDDRYVLRDRMPVNVKDHGAKTDGTDTTPQAQDAVTAAGPGGHVHWPGGTYVINNLAPLTRQTWTGIGKATVLKAKAGATRVVDVNGDPSGVNPDGCNDLHLRDLVIDGNERGSDGLRILGYAQKQLFTNVTWQNCATAVVADGGGTGRQVDKNTYVGCRIGDSMIGIHVNSENGQQQFWVGGEFATIFGTCVKLFGGTFEMSGGQLSNVPRIRAGRMTSGSNVVTGLAKTSDLWSAGDARGPMRVFGAGIPAGATLTVVDSSSQVHLSDSATATGDPTLTVTWGRQFEFTGGNVAWVRLEAVITEGYADGFCDSGSHWPEQGVTLEGSVVEAYGDLAIVDRAGSIVGLRTFDSRLHRGAVILRGNDTYWLKERTTLETGATLARPGGNTKLYESPTRWHEVGSASEPGFQNSWTNNGAGYDTAAYAMGPDGTVQLKGFVKAGTIGNPIFTLPDGYRPQATRAFGTDSNGAFGVVLVAGDGKVTCDIGNNANVSLDGISFSP